jgi:hypothetical protein
MKKSFKSDVERIAAKVIKAGYKALRSPKITEKEKEFIVAEMDGWKNIIEVFK